MIEKKHNLIYQITNTSNGKIYIGRHITDKLDDGYLGSGNEIVKAIKEFGKSNFRKEILFDFDNAEEMIRKELELLTKEFVCQESNYNVFDNTGGKGMMGKTHDSDARKRISEANTGIVSVKDKDGNNLKVSKDDPRYLSGELKHNTHGTVCVKDSEGNKFRVPIDDPRRLTKQLIGMNTGVKRPTETVKKHVEFMKEYWSENTHSDQSIEKMREANIGKVNVRDKDGNEIRVDKNDPRIESGEFVNASKGSVWVHNKDLQKSRFVRPEKVQGFLDEGWELGLVYFNKKKRIWITNHELHISKQIEETELESAIKDGWCKGRISPDNIGEKIKASRNPGTWMRNPESGERRIILNELTDEYLENGWIFGRGKLK